MTTIACRPSDVSSCSTTADRQSRIAVPPVGLISSIAPAMVAASRVGPVIAPRVFANGATTTVSIGRSSDGSLPAASRTNSMRRAHAAAGVDEQRVGRRHRVRLGDVELLRHAVLEHPELLGAEPVHRPALASSTCGSSRTLCTDVDWLTSIGLRTIRSFATLP